MTFDKTNWAKMDVGYSYTAPQRFGYISSTDAMGTIAASAYFNDVAIELRQYDIIEIIGSNGTGAYQITSATGATPVTVQVAYTAQYVIDFSGELTTVGGAATEDFTVTGLVAGQKVFVQMKDDGTNNVTILAAEANATDTLRVTFSGDPGNDAIFYYMSLHDVF